MDFDLAGKCALVTGGSLGIGREVATVFAEHGVNVAITARDADRLKRAAVEIAGNRPGKVVPVPADMSRAEDITRAVAEANRSLGRIDILVNNAGSSPAGWLANITDEQWLDSFNLKLMGYVRTTRAVIPAMKERRWGRVINIMGRGGHQPSAHYVLGCFNAALHNFTQAIAEECSPHGVLVTGINPGVIATTRHDTMTRQRALAEKRSEAEIKAETAKTIPVGRIGRADDIANAVLFLASERASYIAGTWINIDGGASKGI